MAKDKFSFDIVSEVDMQEVDNAINQAKKELANRYDFKDSKSSIEFKRAEKQIILVSSDDYKIRSLKDIVLTKMARRNVAIKALVFGEPESVFGENLKQVATITTGIEKEKAKELVKKIKSLGLKKVQTQIEGEKLRVFAPKKDDLQAVIEYVKGLDYSIPLTFENYR